MCGISGVFDRTAGTSEDVLRSIALEMSLTLLHRGPDDHGLDVRADRGIALSHTRLSVIDLSLLGHQPMSSRSGRWTITYNGEIYNYRALRETLMSRGRNFRGHSDTEVLVEAIDEFGVRGAVERCNGMFAFAAWDDEDRCLVLARDRLGEKPLYWGWAGGTFCFASELKALRQVPGLRTEVDPRALSQFLKYGYLSGRQSIFRGVERLPPASILTVPQVGEPVLQRYWEVAAGRLRPSPRVDPEFRDLEELLGDAIGIRMIADVPLGAFLSGGIDSSLVVALMQAQSSTPVRTFSIGFHESGYDEATFARKVASHLGTEHTELYVSPAEALDVIPRLPTIADEPFGDSSLIPTFLVAQLARQSVTVSLSGDGGDELFGGYDRYHRANAIWNRVSRVPRRMRPTLVAALTRPSTRTWDRLGRSVPTRWRREIPDVGHKVHRLAEILASPDERALYDQLSSHWQHPDALTGHEPYGLESVDGSYDLLEWMMRRDAITYLPDDILAKIDRSTMAVSLESRVPLLDHRVVEQAFGMSTADRVGPAPGKRALRTILARHVPRELFERPKMGFGVPIGAWLRGPLRPWAEDLLDADRLSTEGHLDAAVVRMHWQEHLDGERNWQYALWDVLMFQAWLEHQ